MDQLAKEQHVPIGHAGDLLQAGAVDVAAEDLLHQLADVRVGQGLDLDPAADAVLPEGADGIRRGLAAAQRHQDEGGLRRRQLMDQRRRPVVEKVRVIHEDGQPAALRVLHQRLPGLAQDLQPVGDPSQGRRQQRRQRTERDAGGGPRGHGIECGPAPCPSSGERLPGQPALPDSGGAREHHAPERAPLHRLRDEVELLLPADERPCGDHEAVDSTENAVRGPAWNVANISQRPRTASCECHGHRVCRAEDLAPLSSAATPHG
jgi:hypothetical protein